MNALDLARAVMAAALADVQRREAEHDSATKEEGRAVLALSEAETRVEDDPSDLRVATWRRTREAREVAALAARGTAKRLDAARATHADAARAECRERLSESMERANRGALFAGLADVLEELRALEDWPRVDVTADVPEAVLGEHLREQGARDATRELRRRAVRLAVKEQNEAVRLAKEAAAELGEKCSAAEVHEREVLALVSIPPRSVIEDGRLDGWTAARARWSAWLGTFTGSPTMAEESRVAVAFDRYGRDPATIEAWARNAVLTGQWGDPPGARVVSESPFRF